MSAADIFNAAKDAWDIIKDNAPSTDIQGSTANAVPRVDDWQSITGAKGPNIYSWYYHVPYVDVWPFSDYDHVQIKFKLKWEIGARYRGGGAYIPNVWIEIPECYVGLGWHADIRFTAHNPSNTGSETAPIARIPCTVAGTVHSAAESYHLEWSFILNGDGTSETS
jgi:hypothetical protein